MRCPEPDLERIKPLLSADAWRDEGRKDARRMALAAGLAWYCGAKVMEMARLTLGHVRLGDDPVVLLDPLTEKGANRMDAAPFSARIIPLLPPVAELVAARLAERPDAPLESLLLGSGPEWATSGRGVMEQSGPIMARMSAGRIDSMKALALRYRRYVRWDHEADPTLVAWLASTPDVSRFGPEPPLTRKRGYLAAVHPLPKIGAWLDA
jgi:integrase